MENPGFKRAIRSFVLRQGHLSASQQRAIDEGMPRWGIEYRPEQLDLAQAFGRDAPKILEIGFGIWKISSKKFSDWILLLKPWISFVILSNRSNFNSIYPRF